ncbi:MAG: porin [Gallionellaceae bacterium]
MKLDFFDREEAFMARKSTLIMLFALAAVFGNAHAAEPDQPMFTLSGFGSLGLSHSSESLGDYVLDSGIPKGPGLSENWSVDNDTRIAAHLAANFSPKLSAVIQADSEYHNGNTYQPEVEFADVKYAFLPNASIRAGRLALPTFLEAENRDVGYSYPWIHPPLEVYRQEPITHFDGVDATYRLQTGEVGNSIKVVYGKTTIDSNDFPSGELSSRHLWGIFDTVEYGPTTIHAGYQKREDTSQYLEATESIATVSNSDLSLGVIYDPGDWFVMSEWIQHNSIYKVGAMYISAGYRVNKFTPYLTYSQNSQGSFLPEFQPPRSYLVQLANRSQSTVSLGVRWDFMKNTDLKLQLDEVKLSDNSNGFLANVPEDVNLYGTSFHVISAVADFVF